MVLHHMHLVLTTHDQSTKMDINIMCKEGVLICFAIPRLFLCIKIIRF